MQDLFFFSHPSLFARLARGTFLLILVVWGVLLAAPFGNSIAHASGGQANFALEPVHYDPSVPLTRSYFIFDSKPGFVVKSSVRVTNSGTVKGRVSLYPVDATTGQTSGAVYLNQNDPRKDVGTWIALGAQQLTLNAGQSQIVSFQVTVPGTVRSGQHLGGIVAENLTQSSSSQSNSAIQIKVKNLTIIAVQVNLPGTPVEQMVGTGVQAGGENSYQQLLVGLSNTGTVMLKPSGTLQVANAQGQVLKKVSLKLDTFLPQSAINYPVAITGKALAAGDYQATVDLRYGHARVLHYTTSFTITPRQIAQTFGSTASKTQAPPGLLSGSSSSPLLWLSGIAGLVILLVAGNIFYWRIVVSRNKAANKI